MIRNAEVMAGEAGRGVVFLLYFNLSDCLLECVPFPTSVQVNGDGRSLPVQHLVVTTSSEQSTTSSCLFAVFFLRGSLKYTQ